MKILHLPSNIAGNSYGLSRGERACGEQSDVVQVTDSWLHYPADRTLYPDIPKNKPQWVHLGLKISYELLKTWGRYDVYHFDFGRSFFDLMGYVNMLDLPFYPGVKAMTFQGCDARQKYKVIERTPVAACHISDCYGGICNSRKLDEMKARRIEKIDRYVDLIYALNPDLLYLLPERTKFLPYTIPYWDKIEPVNEYEPHDKLRIVHAPTDRAVKGTNTIIQVMHRLQKECPDKVEFVLIEKMSHRDALEQFRSADLVIDQLLVGWYGAFAVELMKMGIPVMSFIKDEDLKFIPYDMSEGLRKSVINVSRMTLEPSLELIIENPDILNWYHREGLNYVNEWHDPVKIAKGVINDYREVMK